MDSTLLTLADPRLPPHPNLLVVHHTFKDTLHPQLLPGFDAEVYAPDTIFVVMDLYAGTLQSVLSARGGLGMEKSEVLHVAIGLASALLHLQDNGFAHRDVKPDNVFFRTNNVLESPVVLADLGEAFDFTTANLPNFRVPYLFRGFPKGGATRYLPPEIMETAPAQGAVLDYSKSDAWGLGMVLGDMMAPPRERYGDSLLGLAQALLQDVARRPRLKEALSTLKEIVGYSYDSSLLEEKDK